MKGPLLALAATFSIIALAACTKKPPVVTEPVKETPPVEAPVVQPAPEPQGPSDEELAAAALEAKRLQVEKLINEIMENEIYFQYDKAELTSTAREKLSKVGDILTEEPRLVVKVEGHTDERGTESYNMVLGSKRANSIQAYLRSYGIAENRLATYSKGEEYPKDPGHDESAWSKNRRAEFKVEITN